MSYRYLYGNAMYRGIKKDYLIRVDNDSSTIEVFVNKNWVRIYNNFLRIYDEGFVESSILYANDMVTNKLTPLSESQAQLMAMYE
jgi:hypothetical protein